MGNNVEIMVSRNWAEMTVEARIEERPTEMLLEMERRRIYREEQKKKERKERMRGSRGNPAGSEDRLKQSDR